MSEKQDDVDLEMDRLPIPAQLKMAEHLTEEVAASMAVTGAMLARLFSAAEVGVFNDDEGERFIALLRRINFIVATAQRELVIEL